MNFFKKYFLPYFYPVFALYFDRFQMNDTEYSYIRGILNNDSRLLEEIYRKYLPPVFGMIRRNKGNFDDAKDVFQEAILVVYNHAGRPGFQLSSPFQAYLMGICRFLWLRQLKKNARTEVTFAHEERLDIDADLERQIFEVEKRTLFREKFARLGEDCRRLLQRFFDREPLNSIADDMGYTADYVKKKNKVCKEKLMDMVREDPRFGEISSFTASS